MATDDLSSFLLNDHRRAAISPEALEQMGKDAAAMFLSGGLALNAAVVKLASSHNDINHEQVKRVCEFANTAVYLAKHDSSKTAGAESSYPTFALADAARVIQDLHLEASPVISNPGDVSYGQSVVRKEKISSNFADPDGALAEVFGFTEKSDGHFTRETAATEVASAKDLLLGTKQNLEHAAAQFDGAIKEANDGYYETVKRYLLSDTGNFSDVMAAARHAADGDDEKIAAVIKPVAEKLLQEKVATAAQLQNGVRNLEKIAHRVLNDAHPLVSTVKAIIGIEDEISKVASALEDVNGQLAVVNGFIKEKFLARSAL